jgi:beta-glucosidase
VPDYTKLTSFGPVPEGFIWGTATAAHQIEGGNTNTDWWRFEHAEGSGTAESSGDACDSFNRWREDLQLVKDMGLDAYRFSIEWARIEPADGEFSTVALDHYRQIMETAHAMGLKNVVTFHHFTTPLWLADMGGWTNPVIVEKFARYCDVAVKHLGEFIDVACTINEPNMVAWIGYDLGAFPPGHKGDLDSFRAATKNFAAAHRAARPVLKAGPGDFPVGITVAISDTRFHLDGDRHGPETSPFDLPDEFPGAEHKWLMVDAYLEAAEGDDFVGVQTYSTHHVGPDGQHMPPVDGQRTTQMGWPFSPGAIGQTVRYAARKSGLPVMVTENGVAASDDADRIEYISGALTALREAMDDGVDVRGYFYWSLLDNFEWASGYAPKFGLTEVDRSAFARTPKPSSAYFASLVASSR